MTGRRASLVSILLAGCRGEPIRQTVSILVALLGVGCGAEPPRRVVAVRGCDLPELRILMFEHGGPDTCSREDPSGPGGDVDADPSVIAFDPREGEPVEIRAPLDVRVALVAQCREEGVVRRWACDDEQDGELSLVLSDVLLGGCTSPTCPASGARWWAGAGGEVCVAVALPADPCVPEPDGGVDAGGCECRAAELEVDVDCELFCSRRERTCDDGCHWSGWSLCTGPPSKDLQDAWCDDLNPCTQDVCGGFACSHAACELPEVCCPDGCRTQCL